MVALSCCTRGFKALSRAAAKAATSRLRRMGLGATAPDWADRAAFCERCPLRVVRGGISYCGTPFLEQIDRTNPADGCGCPTVAKAKDPAEHCPVDARHQPARKHEGRCTCKWCALASHRR